MNSVNRVKRKGDLEHSSNKSIMNAISTKVVENAGNGNRKKSNALLYFSSSLWINEDYHPYTVSSCSGRRFNMELVSRQKTKNSGSNKSRILVSHHFHFSHSRCCQISLNRENGWISCFKYSPNSTTSMESFCSDDLLSTLYLARKNVWWADPNKTLIKGTKKKRAVNKIFFHPVTSDTDFYDCIFTADGYEYNNHDSNSDRRLNGDKKDHPRDEDFRLHQNESSCIEEIGKVHEVLQHDYDNFSGIKNEDNIHADNYHQQIEENYKKNMTEIGDQLMRDQTNINIIENANSETVDKEISQDQNDSIELMTSSDDISSPDTDNIASTPAPFMSESADRTDSETRDSSQRKNSKENNDNESFKRSWFSAKRMLRPKNDYDSLKNKLKHELKMLNKQELRRNGESGQYERDLLKQKNKLELRRLREQSKLDLGVVDLERSENLRRERMMNSLGYNYDTDSFDSDALTYDERGIPFGSTVPTINSDSIDPFFLWNNSKEKNNNNDKQKSRNNSKRKQKEKTKGEKEEDKEEKLLKEPLVQLREGGLINSKALESLRDVTDQPFWIPPVSENGALVFIPCPLGTVTDQWISTLRRLQKRINFEGVNMIGVFPYDCLDTARNLLDQVYIPMVYDFDGTWFERFGKDNIYILRGNNISAHSRGVNFEDETDRRSMYCFVKILQNDETCEVELYESLLKILFKKKKKNDATLDTTENYQTGHARLILNHSTHLEGLIPLLEKVALINNIQSVIPGRISMTKGRCPKMTIRVTMKTNDGFKLLARKGKMVQEVFIVTKLDENTVDEMLSKLTNK